MLSPLLDRILMYMAQFGQPVETLQPGLTLSQIETLVGPFPFYLPREVYELYQWRNGGREDVYSFFLSDYRFLSLQEAIALWRELDWHEEDWEPVPGSASVGLSQRWFPLFEWNGYFYMAVGEDHARETGPILSVTLDCEEETVAASLKGFLLAVEECWRTGIYQDDNDMDFAAEEAIFRKYATVE